MRRTTALIAATLAAVALFASPVAAQDYDGVTTGLTTTTATPEPGGTIVIAGTGCAPGQTVNAFISDSPAGSTTANASGAFSASITAPTTPGQYRINAVCGTQVFGIVVNVGGLGAPPTQAPGGDTGGAGELPVTGSNSLPLVKVGAVLIAAGGIAVLAVRRQRPATVSVSS
ncbi:MAG: hypothetical protein JJE52_18120 [Acidimicrobiia bacterium]|nr:hypothetical protein [Acidimicrobiia bacterium]